MSAEAEAFAGEVRRRGWARLPASDALARWAAAVRPVAAACAADPALRQAWLRHGGTWFAGVGVLPNDGAGRVAGGPPLPAPVQAAAEEVAGRPLALEPGQVSVCYPGYPRRDAAEPEGAARYRRLRDAAHLDGLLPEGPARRRFLREPHAVLIGLALNEADPDAAPLVVWEGSAEVMRGALRKAIGAADPGEVDLTDAYQAARREVFETCPRIEVAQRPGEAVLLHRLTLHGVAPWVEGAGAAPEGRMIAYFRPECGLTPRDWLDLP